MMRRQSRCAVLFATAIGPSLSRFYDEVDLMAKFMQSRIMYIELKSDGLSGPARIGRVRFSRSGKSLYYRGRTLQTLAGQGFKANYFDVVSGEQFWVSGCKKRGGDSLYGNVITIDEDVRDEYWTKIRGRRSLKECSSYKGAGKYR